MAAGMDVTILVTNALFDRSMNELARNFEPDEAALAKHVRYAPSYIQRTGWLICHSGDRIVSLGDIPGVWSADGNARFKEAWTAIVNEQELVCALTGSRYEPAPKPKAIIMDVRDVSLPSAVR